MMMVDFGKKRVHDGLKEKTLATGVNLSAILFHSVVAQIKQTKYSMH